MRDPKVIDLQNVAGSANLRPYVLKFYTSAEATTLTEVKFIADLFSPEGESESRLAKITLLKGTAIQHTPPRSNLSKISITGVFMSKEMMDRFMWWYLSNTPYQDDPYPTEYLTLYRDFAELHTPEGEIYLVSAAGKPTIQPTRASQGRVIHEFSADLFRVDLSETL